jgi:hypothetical protein
MHRRLPVLAPDLTKNGQLCLSKALIASVSFHCTEIATYSKYFKDFTLANPDSNLSCIKARPHMFSKVVNSMYNVKEPTSAPAFFSFDSFYDVCRLSKIVKREIVIYYNVKNSVEIYHDFRGVSSFLEPIFFLLTTTKSLHLLRGSLDSKVDYANYLCEPDATIIDSSVSDTWGSDLCDMLSVPKPSWQLDDLTCLSTTRNELFKLWNQNILFVVLCRSKFNAKIKTAVRKNPKFSYFTTVAFVGPGLRTISDLDLMSSTKVVCFFAGSKACILNEEFRVYVIQNLLLTTNRDKPQPNNLFDIPYVNLEGRRIAEALERAKKEKKLSAAELKGKKCKCNTCNLTTDYDYNMSTAGPERLMTYRLDVSELLTLLGLDSSVNLNILEEMRSLSLASMDIESMTVSLDLQPPVEPDTGLVYGVIDEAVLEGHLKKVQKPIMIAHLDKLLGDVPIVFTASSDKEEDIYKMMRDYWGLVAEQHARAKSEKRKLAQPLFDIIYKYRETHFTYYNDWCVLEGDDPTQCKSISRAWKQSIPGKLEQGLQKLITDYIIFSFYG